MDEPHLVHVFVAGEAPVGEGGQDNPGQRVISGAPVSGPSLPEGLIAHALDDVAASVGDGVDGAEVVAMEIAGPVRPGAHPLSRS